MNGTPTAWRLRRLRAFVRTLAGEVTLLVLAFAVAGGIAFVRSDAFGTVEGYVAAQIDVHRGKLVVHTKGFHPGWSATYYRLFRENYGVEIDPGSILALPPKAEAWRQAYNVVSMAEIRRRFGGDVFERTRDEAIQMDIDAELPRKM